MCPTGALKRTEVKGEKRLMFTSSACNGCRLCQEFCKKAAIEIVGGFAGDPEEPLCIY
jgi:Pyruvate/2-oxoacid:ferredoxin oxidoreductase delta subunit